MSKKKLSLIISIIALAVSLVMVVGVTFALFSDKVILKNHLQVGKFDAQLVRTNFTYTRLDENGRIVTETIDEKKDFTEATTEGIFGEAIENLKIVPGTYFEASLELTNEGEVAFDYYVTLDLIAGYDSEMNESVSNALAEQMLVTVTYADGTTSTCYLSDCKEGNSFDILNGIAFDVTNGKNMTASSGAVDAFKIKVEFLDLDTNNLAKGQSVEFDITVRAVQEAIPTEAATEAPTEAPNDAPAGE